MKIINRLSTVIITTILLITMCMPVLASKLPADGSYNVAATLTGGTGRVIVESPAKLTISGGQMRATIVLKRTGSGLTTYSWMKVEDFGETYNNQAALNENSKFTIPISALDKSLNVSIYSDVMGTEIAYTLRLDSSSLPAEETTSNIQETTTSAGGGVDPKNSGSNVNNNNNTQTTTSTVNINTGDSNNNLKDDDSQNNLETKELETFEYESVEELEDGNKLFNINGGVNTSVTIPAETLQRISGSSLSVSTAFGTVEFNKDAVEGFVSKAKGAVTLSFKNISDNKKYINSNYERVVELSLTDADGNELFSEGKTGKANVSIKYNKNVASNEKVKIYYITDSGQEEIKGKYDTENKTVTFEVEHFSIYGLMKENIEIEQKDTSSNGIFIIFLVAVVVIGLGVISWRKIKRRKS